ncbi:MAG TPA: DapH/DapD/GlmU-related protein [Dehalococcoidia bacterium]|nr:DapH/DapD/GlmU-related protein [Dehalococcoidia bacterium]
MSKNDFPTLAARPGPVDVAPSAAVLGAWIAGEGVQIAQGAVVRSLDSAVQVGGRSALLENGVIIGSPALPVQIGQKVVFGHRCLIVGATVGDLCEIGNASILLPGARLGSRCFLGEGTLIPAGMVIPDDSVVIGRPGRIRRRVNDEDIRRLSGLRGGDLSLARFETQTLTGSLPAGAEMGTLYSYQDKSPRVASSAILFDTAEITGDVSVGEDSIIGAGVKIIGDSHGPVRIGARVQILENTVLHLLPDNELVLEDDVVIGPGAMIHGCHLGRGTIVEPGAIVCDGSRLGRDCRVGAGSLVPQRAEFGDDLVLEGFPVKPVGSVAGPQRLPAWALHRSDLPSLVRLR